MATITVRQFAGVLKVPVAQLVRELHSAGIMNQNADDSLGDDQRLKFLTHLRNTDGHAVQSAAEPERPAVRTPVRPNAPARTALEQSAFAVLGATLRDSRQRLVELAEQRALAGHEDDSTAARGQVTNPRTRLAAEIGWFPGTSPTQAAALVDGLRQNPRIVRGARGLNSLTMANLMASAMELIDPAMSPEEWAGWLVALARAEDEIDAAEVLRDINEDRAVAGFPEVRDVVSVEAALAERRRHYKDATLAALESVASEVLVEAITRAVTEMTSNGTRHAPLLIEDITSAYELRASHAMEKGAKAVLGIVEAVRSKASGGAPAVSPEITRLERSVRQWDKLAQPVQLLAKSRGQEHEMSRGLAYSIRSLGIDLVNEHSMIDQGQRITAILADVFAELPEVVDRLESDSEVLRNLKTDQDEGERRSSEWAEKESGDPAHEPKRGWTRAWWFSWKGLLAVWFLMHLVKAC